MSKSVWDTYLLIDRRCSWNNNVLVSNQFGVKIAIKSLKVVLKRALDTYVIFEKYGKMDEAMDFLHIIRTTIKFFVNCDEAYK